LTEQIKPINSTLIQAATSLKSKPKRQKPYMKPVKMSTEPWFPFGLLSDPSMVLASKGSTAQYASLSPTAAAA